jgi:hypothetical protein
MKRKEKCSDSLDSSTNRFWYIIAKTRLTHATGHCIIFLVFLGSKFRYKVQSFLYEISYKILTAFH